MNNKPLVSVAMGIYNCADTLEGAVQCIINQTYTNWELIMCDDASKDNTYEIALKLASKDNRIIVLKNESNMTLAPTLNKCIEHSKGKYIARMDGDDICDPTRFEKEVAILEANAKYAIVSCQMNLYDKEGIYRIIVHPDEPTPNEMIKRSQFCHAGCMVRADVIKAVGGYSNSPKKNRVEDYDLWARMYAQGYVGFNIQEPLYSMRDDRNALSRRNFNNRKNEVRVKNYIMKTFNLSIKNYIYVVMPIIKWLVPNSVYKIAHRK